VSEADLRGAPPARRRRDRGELARSWLAPAVGALALAPALGACGGIQAPDLFIVQRSGSVPGARLTLLVNEEGGVHCNGGGTLKLSDPALIEARAIQEEISSQAAKHLALPARPGSVLSYYLRDENGTVSFSDNSTGQSSVLRRLAAFVLQTAQRVCHLPM
jgi:hypothetical protein